MGQRDTELDAAVAELATSEARYRLLAENASDVVYQTDPAGTIQWVSPSVGQVLGWDPAQLVGVRAVDLVYPDDLAQVERLRPQVYAGAPVRGVLTRFTSAAGDLRWMSVRASPLRAPDGTVTGAVVGLRDVDELVRAQQEAEAGRLLLQATMDAMLDPHLRLECVRDGSGRIVDFRCVDANPAATAFEGLPKSELIGRSLLELLPGHLEAGLFTRYCDVVETGQPLALDAFPHRSERRGGQVQHTDIRCVRVGDGLSLSWRDVTEQQRDRDRLAASEQQFRLLAENISDVVWNIAPDGRASWVSASVTGVLGWRPDEVIGKVVTDFAHPDDLDGALSLRDTVIRSGSGEAELRFRCGDGGYRWVGVSGRAVPTAEGVGRVIAMRDIHEAVLAREELERVIGHDTLTGLASRATMLARLEEELRASSRTGRSVAVLCVGVDSLSSVNAALTHAGGDLVLVSLAARIDAVVGDAERIGRGTGAEFVVVVPDLADVAAAALVAERIRVAVKEPLVVSGHEVRSTVSIGIATGTGADAERLVRDATLAMRQAKQDGRDRTRFFDPVLAVAAERHLELMALVREGLERQQFVAWYQPIVHFGDERPTGYEALVRWVRDDASVVTPDSFLPTIEGTPLVCDVDRAVLEHAVRVLQRLPRHLIVAVNVSAHTLAAGDYAPRLEELLRSCRVEPSRLHVEVTETSLLNVGAASRDAMKRIARTGARWYVDDFGTGYSSISHLRDLPVSGLKLDTSFTRGIEEGDITSIRLAQALAGMAQGLGLDTVAEGVETLRQAAILASQGWQHAQGWLYGRPSPEPAGTGEGPLGRPTPATPIS